MSRRPSQLNIGDAATSNSVGERRAVHFAASEIWRCGLRVSTKPHSVQLFVRDSLRVVLYTFNPYEGIRRKRLR